MSRMKEQIVNETPAIFAGIDVGKQQLDAFIHPLGAKIQR